VAEIVDRATLLEFGNARAVPCQRALAEFLFDDERAMITPKSC
jgi:hypothetical protein